MSIRMKNKKPLLVLFIFVFLGLAGIGSFLYYFSQHDRKAISEFSIAYNNYDHAVLELSNSVLTSNPDGIVANRDLENKASDALVVLKSKASVRISSLTIHDSQIMDVTLEIADLAENELDALEAASSALIDKKAGADALVDNFNELNIERQAAMARFYGLEDK